MSIFHKAQPLLFIDEVNMPLTLDATPRSDARIEAAAQIYTTIYITDGYKPELGCGCNTVSQSGQRCTLAYGHDGDCLPEPATHY